MMSATSKMKPCGWIHAGGAAVCVGLTCAAVLWCVQPMLEARRLARADQAELNTVKNDAVKKSVELKRLVAELQSAQAALESIPLRLQSIRQVNHRLAKLTDLATRVGLRVEHVNPGATQDVGSFSQMSIRIQASGAFPNCVTFLHALREELEDTGVASFTIAGRPAPTHVNATFNCELTWYALPDAAADRRVDVSAANPSGRLSAGVLR